MTLHYSLTRKNDTPAVEVRDQDEHLRGVITPAGSASGVYTLALTLEEGDTADNPASTKTNICGPALVDFTFWPDGGIDAAVQHNEVSI